MDEQTLEVVTRIAVVVFFAAAFIAAAAALRVSRMWSRKVSSTTIMVIAAAWSGFYLYLLLDGHRTILSDTAVILRVIQYVTATGLFIMANLISRSERYGVHVMTRFVPSDVTEQAAQSDE